MRLDEYLASLGNTADEVANSLRRQGVKGKIGSTCYCPILNAIYKACPDYCPGLMIDGRPSETGNHGYQAILNDSQIMDPSLPKPVQLFVGEFDLGKYPDLVATTVKEVRTRVWS